MTHLTHIEQVPFAQIANSVLRDERLSFKARGILAYVLSHSQNFNVTRETIESASLKDGRDAVQSALNELTEFGYRTIVKTQAEDGTWTSTIYWTQAPYEESTDGRVFRTSVNPSANKNTNKEHKVSKVSLSSNVSSEEAEALVIQELGASEIEREDASPLTSNREIAIAKANTETPRPLWATFNPENAGYLREDFKREFPLCDWSSTVARFVDFHLDKGSKSNWMVAFLGYAAEAQRRAAVAQQSGGTETDSMGLPLDASKRRMGDTPEAKEQRIETYKAAQERARSLEAQMSAEELELLQNGDYEALSRIQHDTDPKNEGK